MQLAAVGAAVKVISDFVAAQPFLPYRTRNGSTTLADDHPAYRVFKLRANPFMSAYILIQLIQSHALRWGNGYAFIEFDQRGMPVYLWPLAPWATSVLEHEGQIYYRTQLLGKANPTQIILGHDEVLHIKCIGSDGFTGTSPIRQHAEEIGIQIAAQNYGAEFFGNGAVIQGYLKIPGAIKAEHRDEIKKSWKSVFGGTGNRHQTPVLSNGMEYQRIGIPPEEAQFLESRTFGSNQIAQIFGVPPSMMGLLDKATFSNITEESINFVRRTLTPWFIQWEQEASYKIFSTREQKTLSMVFDRSKVLRGTPKEEAEADVSLTNAGIITRNEARKSRNLNPIDGLDTVLVPLNMIETDDDGEPVESGTEPESGSDARAADPLPLFESFAEKMSRAIKKSSAGWDGEVFINRNLGPICNAFDRNDVLESFVTDYKIWESGNENKKNCGMTPEIITKTLGVYYGD
jgi:HK97 family phage portal protein